MMGLFPMTMKSLIRDSLISLYKITSDGLNYRKNQSINLKLE